MQIPDIKESDVNEAVEAILEFKRIKLLPDDQKAAELDAWEKQIETLHFVSDKKSSELSHPDEAVRSVQWYFQMSNGNIKDSILESTKWKRFTQRLNFDDELKEDGFSLPEVDDLDHSEYQSLSIIAVLWYQQLLEFPSSKIFEEFDKWQKYVFEVGIKMNSQETIIS